jgi:glutamate 5-kinase
VIDAGAAAALKKEKRSLLAAGIVEVQGSFERGDLIDVADLEGSRLGSGISNYSAADISAIKGVHSDEIAGKLGHDFGPEVIHRNNLAVA